MKNSFLKNLHTNRKYRFILYAILALVIAPIVTMLLSPKTQDKPETKPQQFTLPFFTKNPTPTAIPPIPLTVIDSVGMLMDLPTDEEPMIATITDPSVLQDQEFFHKAIVGDKVLIYKNNQLAILYRPEINKIINTADAVFEIEQPDATPSAEITP